MLTTESEQERAKKWEGRSVLGIHLGPSPHYVVSVSLVLNLATGNASSQFHVGHDDFFETTRYNSINTRSESNFRKLSVINHTNTIEKKEKVMRAALARSKTDSSSGFTHRVDLANQAPEGTPEKTFNPVPSNG